MWGLTTHQKSLSQEIQSFDTSIYKNPTGF